MQMNSEVVEYRLARYQADRLRNPLGIAQVQVSEFGSQTEYCGSLLFQSFIASCVE
jgi:hypothetical protein